MNWILKLGIYIYKSSLHSGTASNISHFTKTQKQLKIVLLYEKKSEVGHHL